MIENCGLLTEEYHVKAKALQRKYYPLEVDPSIPHEEKKGLMVEWFEKAHDVLVRTGLTRRHIKEAVRGSKLTMRTGAVQLLASLEGGGVPALVFSAGLADVLSEALRQRAQLSPNMHVVANFMRFESEEEGAPLVGFKDPLFHVFNKKAEAVAHMPWFGALRRRRNAILMGDNLGDLHMSDGLDADTVLSVGFLNDRVEDRLEEYASRFDVVVVNDGGVEYVQELVDQVLAAV